MPGNRLGSKSKYVYTNDFGDEYLLTLDDDLVLTNSGLTVAPAGTTAQPAPKRFQPRGVYVQQFIAGQGNARKFLVAGTPAAGLYATNSPQDVTIDGETFTSTGRRGERQTF